MTNHQSDVLNVRPFNLYDQRKQIQRQHYIVAFIFCYFFFYFLRNALIHDSAKIPQTLCFIIVR